MKTNILFIGSFLSRSTGTRGASEKIMDSLFHQNNLTISFASESNNKFIRLLDIIYTSSFTNYDIVHIDVYSNNAFVIAEVASLLSYFRRKRIILTLRGGALAEFYHTSSKRIRQVFARAEVITTPSRMLQQFFEEKGFKIRYIPNSIELKHFPYNRNSVRPFSLLWVRAFDPIYNPFLAIQTLAKVRESFPEATLTMIGPDKGMLKASKELIAKLNLDHAVEISGPVPNTELYRYYQTRTVFLNTTSYESFGVAVLEAAACGIPVVSNKIGEIPLLWEEDKEMLMVDGLDVEQFAHQINRIWIEPGLNDKISRNARLKAECFDACRVINQWIKIFTD